MNEIQNRAYGSLLYKKTTVQLPLCVKLAVKWEQGQLSVMKAA